MKALKLNTWHNGYVHVYISIMGELVFLKSIDYDEFSNTPYEGYYDVFQSQNTFKSNFSRTEENLLQLRMLYIDIDNVDDREKTIYEINKLVEQKKLPVPTQIIFSGRGIHVKWSLKDYAATKKNLQVWKKIEQYLYETLKSLGADAKAKDPCRILRVVGSINSKSDLIVEELTYNEGQAYDLYNIYNEYLPYIKVAKSKKKKVRQLPTKNLFTLNSLKLEDFKIIVKLRNGDLVGFRNCLIMLYSFHYRLENTVTVEELISVTKEFNSLFNKPLKVSEVKSTCRSCNKRVKEFLKGDKTKAPMKTATIIESLAITEEEQKQLNVLISANVKNYRKRISRRNLDGLTYREEKKQETFDKVQTLKLIGLSQTKVSEELKIGIATVKRHWNK